MVELASPTPRRPRRSSRRSCGSGTGAWRPQGFVATVHDVELAAGAGYVIVEMGEISRMPGLPSSPAAERISLSDDGVVSGVS
jgi:formyltetrahydrofolate synthetase